jgi:hypothetical protein
MLDSSKDYQYSNAIMYCLVHALSSLATQAQTRLDSFAEANRDMLAANACEGQAAKKLQVVFRNEAQTVSGKANSIKVTLMQCETLSKEVFKFPQRQAVRKFLGEYVVGYEAGSKDSTALSAEGSREETLFLLRVVWGCVVAL